MSWTGQCVQDKHAVAELVRPRVKQLFPAGTVLSSAAPGSLGRTCCTVTPEHRLPSLSPRHRTNQPLLLGRDTQSLHPAPAWGDVYVWTTVSVQRSDLRRMRFHILRPLGNLPRVTGGAKGCGAVHKPPSYPPDASSSSPRLSVPQLGGGHPCPVASDCLGQWGPLQEVESGGVRLQRVILSPSWGVVPASPPPAPSGPR